MINLNVWGQGYYHPDKTNTTNTSIGIRAGVWVPVGRLSKTFNPSTSYEFVLGPKGGDVSFQYIHLYGSFTLPKGNSFKFLTADTVVRTKSNLLFMAGFRWRQEEQLAASCFFDFVTIYWGVGVAGFFLDYKNTEGDRGSFANVHWHIGWTFSKRIFNTQFIGITGQYNLIPQRGLREDVGRGFGNTSVNLGFEYRF